MTLRYGELTIGVTTPIVTLNPKGHGLWETTADVADLRRVAQAADRLGYSHLTCSHHAAVPLAAAPVRGATYWDPVATLSFLAAATERIRLATHVVVLGYQSAAEVLSTWSTVDRLSGGRVILGVGVGSLAEEFELLGRPFEHRGLLADEMIADIRSSWGRPEFGAHHIAPTAVGPGPVWVGGRTRRSLRRAIELADGWAPFALSDDDVRAALSAQSLPAGFTVALWAYGIDPLADRDDPRTRLDQLAAIGATTVNVRFSSSSADHWIEQAVAFAALSTA